MNTLPAWVLRLQAIFLAIGTFLTILAFQGGIQIPSFLTGFFTENVWNVLVQAGTALFTAYQVIRAIFVATPKPAGVSTLSTAKINSFAYNPFKLSPA